MVEPKPSFIRYGTLPSAFLLVGTWQRLWLKEWSKYNSAPPSSVRSLRGNYIPVIFLYCGLKNSFCDIPFFFFDTFTGFAPLSLSLPPSLSLSARQYHIT